MVMKKRLTRNSMLGYIVFFSYQQNLKKKKKNTLTVAEVSSVKQEANLTTLCVPACFNKVSFFFVIYFVMCTFFRRNGAAD